MTSAFRKGLGVAAVLSAVALALTACGGISSGSGGPGSGKQLTIGFVPGIASDPFFKAMQAGAEAKAKELGIKLVWQGASQEYSPQSQIPFVDAMLTQHVDGLVIVPTDADALQPSVTKAQSLRIPVVTVDTTVSDRSYLTAAITGDNQDGGRQAAKTLAQQIGDSGQVFMMNGSPTATTDQLRAKGFKAELASHPNIQLVGEEYANSQPAQATSAVTNILLKYQNLKGIFAVDGTAGTGTVAALRNTGKAHAVRLIGDDAYQNQVEDLKGGIYSALVAQKPGDEAALALQDLVDTLTKHNVDKIEKNVVLPNVVMTADNFGQTAHTSTRPADADPRDGNDGRHHGRRRQSAQSGVVATGRHAPRCPCPHGRLLHGDEPGVLHGVRLRQHPAGLGAGDAARDRRDVRRRYSAA